MDGGFAGIKKRLGGLCETAADLEGGEILAQVSKSVVVMMKENPTPPTFWQFKKAPNFTAWHSWERQGSEIYCEGRALSANEKKMNSMEGNSGGAGASVVGDDEDEDEDVSARAIADRVEKKKGWRGKKSRWLSV